MRCQTVGDWLPPVQFPTNYVGCAGSTEAVYGIHAHLIPVGTNNRGKVLIWGKGMNTLCWGNYLTTSPGDYDQQFAIVDADADPVTVTYGSWRIPAAAAPQIYAGSATMSGFTVTDGMQGLFCSGHCWLPDGRLLVVGGTDWSGNLTHPYADFTGSRMVAVYDPAAGPNGTWSTLQQLLPPVPFLVQPRWYPTLLVIYDPLAAGPGVKVIVLGGIEQAVFGPSPSDTIPTNGVFLASDRSYHSHEAYNVELFVGPTWNISKDTRTGGTLPPVPPDFTASTPVPGLFLGPLTSPPTPDFPLGFSLFYYARAHYLSDAAFGGAPAAARGIAWIGGMPAGTSWIDHVTDANIWPSPQPLLTTVSDILEEPTGVLLPQSLAGGENRIALFGGQFGLSGSTPLPVITDAVHVLDASMPAPSWSTTTLPHLNYRRKFADSVLLPDSSVLVVGGGTNGAPAGKGGEVFTPEVYRGTSWENGPPEDSPRTYHSCSLLLPSGRVLSIGGDTRKWDMQIYEPHYWQDGATRPVITTAPASIAFGSNFSVSFTLTQQRTLAKACLTTPGSVTHGHDPNQRLVELSIVNSTSTSATLAAPANPTKAPYGHYMLWLVDSTGEVSAAAWTSL